MRWARIAISTPMITTAIRIYAPTETNVGAVILREDALRIVFEYLERCCRRRAEILDVRRLPRRPRISNRKRSHRGRLYSCSVSAQGLENSLVAPSLKPKSWEIAGARVLPFVVRRSFRRTFGRARAGRRHIPPDRTLLCRSRPSLLAFDPLADSHPEESIRGRMSRALKSQETTVAAPTVRDEIARFWSRQDLAGREEHDANAQHSELDEFAGREERDEVARPTRMTRALVTPVARTSGDPALTQVGAGSPGSPQDGRAL